jgi:cleavage and polyadenylation specificity factor subunit 1
VAISLNLNQRLHPKIWSISRLSTDAYRVVSVPKPLGKSIGRKSAYELLLTCSIETIGGALIISPNVVFYCDQSTKYALQLNQFAVLDENRSYTLGKCIIAFVYTYTAIN